MYTNQTWERIYIAIKTSAAFQIFCMLRCNQVEDKMSLCSCRVVLINYSLVKAWFITNFPFNYTTFISAVYSISKWKFFEK